MIHTYVIKLNLGHLKMEEIKSRIFDDLVEVVENSELPIDKDTRYSKDDHLEFSNKSMEGSIFLFNGGFDRCGDTYYRKNITQSEVVKLMTNLKPIEKLITQKLRANVYDTGDYILRPSGYLNIQADVCISNDADDSRITGWQFILGIDIYTVQDYYKENGLGFYELKLQTLSSYSQDEIAKWAEYIGISVDEQIYANLRQWVDNIKL